MRCWIGRSPTMNSGTGIRDQGTGIATTADSVVTGDGTNAVGRRVGDRVVDVLVDAMIVGEEMARRRADISRAVRRGVANDEVGKMKTYRNVLSALTAVALATGSLGAQAPTAEMIEIGKVLQTAPTPSPGYTRFNFPRRDMTLKVGDVTLSPAMASGAWLGFAGTGEHMDVMGDLVLLPSELLAVQAELHAQGIGISAIHNHLAGAEPQLVYMHVHAMGNGLALAKKFDVVLSKSGIPRPVAAAAPAPVTIDTAMVNKAMGLPGKANGAVSQFSVMLVNGDVKADGMVVVPAQGYGTPINIQMVTPERYVATGDFSVVEARTAPVISALADGGIAATAMHSHLVGESPRVYYIHFWADGAPAKVLAGLRKAMDAGKQ
jgi:hypothetical protein